MVDTQQWLNENFYPGSSRSAERIVELRINRDEERGMVSWSFSFFRPQDQNGQGKVSLAVMPLFTGILTGELDLTGFTRLESLKFSNNQIRSLNVSGLTQLRELHCDNNQLTSLNVSGNIALTSLICFNNPNLERIVGLEDLRNLKNIDCSNTHGNLRPIDQIKQDFNNKLKKINVLIDPQVEHYTEPIDFDGLYKHLKNTLEQAKEEIKRLQTRIQELEKNNPISPYSNNQSEINRLSQELKNVWLAEPKEKEQVVKEWQNKEHEFTILPYQLKDKSWVVLLFSPNNTEKTIDDDVYIYGSQENTRSNKEKIIRELIPYLKTVSPRFANEEDEEDINYYRYSDTFASLDNGNDEQVSFVYRQAIIEKLLNALKTNKDDFTPKFSYIEEDNYRNWRGHRIRINKDNKEELGNFNALLDAYRFSLTSSLWAELENRIKNLLDLDETDKLPEDWDELLVRKSDTISFFSIMKELEKTRNFLEEYSLLMEKEAESRAKAIEEETDLEKKEEYEKEKEEYEAQIEQVDSLIDKF